jgi:hypothetical protein
MGNMVIKVILALLYLFAGMGLFLSRKRFAEEGNPPNIMIPAGLLILAAITTPFL